MSNEVRTFNLLEYRYGDTMVTQSTGSKYFDALNDQFIRSEVEAVDGTWAAIPLGSVSSPGWYQIENVGLTYPLELAEAEGANPFNSIPPGGSASGYFASSAPAIRATGGNTRAKYLIVQK